MQHYQVYCLIPQGCRNASDTTSATHAEFVSLLLAVQMSVGDFTADEVQIRMFDFAVLGCPDLAGHSQRRGTAIMNTGRLPVWTISLSVFLKTAVML